jgi:hypothetical protein
MRDQAAQSLGASLSADHWMHACRRAEPHDTMRAAQRRKTDRSQHRAVRAFSSEVDTGSREENALNRNLKLRF